MATRNTKGIEPHKFKKGQSGNLKGRPPKLPELDKLLAEVLGEEKNGKTSAETILKKLESMAKAGNLRAAEILLNRAYGMPKQRLEHTGEDGGPIKTVIEFIDYEDDNKTLENTD